MLWALSGSRRMRRAWRCGGRAFFARRRRPSPTRRRAGADGALRGGSAAGCFGRCPEVAGCEGRGVAAAGRFSQGVADPHPDPLPRAGERAQTAPCAADQRRDAVGAVLKSSDATGVALRPPGVFRRASPTLTATLARMRERGRRRLYPRTGAAGAISSGVALPSPPQAAERCAARASPARRKPVACGLNRRTPSPACGRGPG